MPTHADVFLSFQTGLILVTILAGVLEHPIRLPDILDQLPAAQQLMQRL